jgi:hypothetical protein
MEYISKSIKLPIAPYNIEEQENLFIIVQLLNFCNAIHTCNCSYKSKAETSMPLTDVYIGLSKEVVIRGRKFIIICENCRYQLTLHYSYSLNQDDFNLNLFFEEILNQLLSICSKNTEIPDYFNMTNYGLNFIEILNNLDKLYFFNFNLLEKYIIFLDTKSRELKNKIDLSSQNFMQYKLLIHYLKDLPEHYYHLYKKLHENKEIGNIIEKIRNKKILN